MNTYEAFYKGKRTTVQANTSYSAQECAAKVFKAKKSYDVTVVLVELGSDTPSPVSVTHTPSE